MPFIYQAKTIQQLRNGYNRRIRGGVNQFQNFEDFLDWYQNQHLVCHYCGLSEMESQQIVMNGVLNSNRFPQNGKVGQGTSRGMWLEVDRLNPKGNYGRDNCVLCCYFCNNDKSDVFSGELYKDFFQNRVEFLRKLLNNATAKNKDE